MRTPPRRTGYTDTIRETLHAVGLENEDPIHVEAWMRIGNPTLDHLTAEAFADEVVLAVACLREAGPETTVRLAASIL